MHAEGEAIEADTRRVDILAVVYPILENRFRWGTTFEMVSDDDNVVMNEFAPRLNRPTAAVAGNPGSHVFHPIVGDLHKASGRSQLDCVILDAFKNGISNIHISNYSAQSGRTSGRTRRNSPMRLARGRAEALYSCSAASGGSQRRDS